METRNHFKNGATPKSQTSKTRTKPLFKEMEKKFTLKKFVLFTAAVLFFSQAFSQLPAYLPANIKAWYPFTGNANDLSPNGLNLPDSSFKVLVFLKVQNSVC